jgi:bacterioferritin
MTERHVDHSFSLDVGAIRKRARSHIERGAVTAGNADHVGTTIRLLNEALATEIVCMLRYKRHAAMAPKIGGILGDAIKNELSTHATEEQEHADMIATRIVQLGGEPDFDPKNLASRSHAEYVAGESLRQMLVEDLVAERIAIETYSEIIRWLADGDPTTRRVMETILEQEEEHADDLADWLERLK